ncbi:hypothetical protein G5I_14737 [Acromyrmex echinatior]|uniref:Uncharacterized protein n=1 Tax=Acromyrmex echinatior TaxID=103372 RepID=F4X8J8_ACREC|nr:hypothetical protein G5I_14737 [Acromyrmex echinatior]
MAKSEFSAKESREKSTYPDVFGLEQPATNQTSYLHVDPVPLSTKALAGAKSLGGFLYSAVNKAGKTVVEASVKIKKTVEENVSFFPLSL